MTYRLLSHWLGWDVDSWELYVRIQDYIYHSNVSKLKISILELEIKCIIFVKLGHGSELKFSKMGSKQKAVSVKRLRSHPPEALQADRFWMTQSQ